MGSFKRNCWVDMAKLFAIFAVMVDHTNGILYSNHKITCFAFYSVSLFIFLMGFSYYGSYERYNGSVIAKVGKGCLKMIRPYLVATFFFCLFLDKQFHLDLYLTRVVHFSACGAFYYVALYLQLLFVNPVLYAVLKYAKRFQWGVAIDVIGLVAVILISWLTTNHTNIIDVYGGGGRLFGGSFLILLYLGMLFGKYYEKISLNRLAAVIGFVLSATLTVAWWYFITVDYLHIDTYVQFGAGFNPPSISFTVYALLMACTIWLSEKVVGVRPRLTKIYEKISLLGRHTLYIFLYHGLFIFHIIPYVFAKNRIVIYNMWLLRIIYVVCMVGGSLLIEFVLERLHTCIKQIYIGNK